MIKGVSAVVRGGLMVVREWLNDDTWWLDNGQRLLGDDWRSSDGGSMVV
jgi:hypothetical protein